MNFDNINKAIQLAKEKNQDYIAKLLEQQKTLLSIDDVQSSATKLRVIEENICVNILKTNDMDLLTMIDMMGERGFLDKDEVHTFHVIRSYGNNEGAHATIESNSIDKAIRLTDELCKILIYHNMFEGKMVKPVTNKEKQKRSFFDRIWVSEYTFTEYCAAIVIFAINRINNGVHPVICIVSALLVMYLLATIYKRVNNRILICMALLAIAFWIGLAIFMVGYCQLDILWRIFIVVLTGILMFKFHFTLLD